MISIEEIRGKNDEDLWAWIGEQVSKMASGGTGQQTKKYTNLGLAELQLRSQRHLRESIDAFNGSSDKYSKKIIRLTRVLIVLTILLLILTGVTAVPIVQSWFAHPAPTDLL